MYDYAKIILNFVKYESKNLIEIEKRTVLSDDKSTIQIQIEGIYFLNLFIVGVANINTYMTS